MGKSQLNAINNPTNYTIVNYIWIQQLKLAISIHRQSHSAYGMDSKTHFSIVPNNDVINSTVKLAAPSAVQLFKHQKTKLFTIT